MKKIILHTTCFLIRNTLAIAFLLSPFVIYKAYDETKAQHLLNYSREQVPVEKAVSTMTAKMEIKAKAKKVVRIASGQEQ